MNNRLLLVLSAMALMALAAAATQAAEVTYRFTGTSGQSSCQVPLCADKEPLVEHGQSFVFQITLDADALDTSQDSCGGPPHFGVDWIQAIYGGTRVYWWCAIKDVYFRVGSIVASGPSILMPATYTSLEYGTPSDAPLVFAAHVDSDSFQFLDTGRTVVGLLGVFPFSPFTDGSIPMSLPQPVGGSFRLWHFDAQERVAVELVGTVTKVTAGAPSTQQLLTEMTSLVMEINADSGLANSFDAKLVNLIAALDDTRRGNKPSAINMLAAFINAAEGQRGQQLSTAQADQLINAANEIMVMLAQP